MKQTVLPPRPKRPDQVRGTGSVAAGHQAGVDCRRYDTKSTRNAVQQLGPASRVAGSVGRMMVTGLLVLLAATACNAPIPEDRSYAVPPVVERRADDLTAAQQVLIDVLKEHVRHVVRLNRTPGLNLALALDGQVVWEAGFGFADLGERTPMTPDAVTHSGSMGKTYTGTAVLQLVERGVLDLDAPVNDYLPGWRIENPLGGRDITVRDLLTHRSGLTGNAAFSVYDAPRPLRDHVPAAYRRTHFKPYGNLVPLWSTRAGEAFSYSNLGIATLGYLVDVANPDGVSFSDWVQRHIMDPLGMTSSQYPPVQDSAHVRPDLWARMSRGYARFGSLRLPTPPIYFEDHPAGTVVTTPGDHIRLLLAFMGGGSLGDSRILSTESVDAMLTADDGSVTGDGQGLIWRLQDMGTPSFAFGHGGAHMWGWTNQFIAFPRLGAALAVSMNNWDVPGDPDARYREAFAIIDFLHSWLVNDRATDPRSTSGRSWAWKYSYVTGLLLAERIHGALGIREPTTELMIEDMVAGARVMGDGSAHVLWDPDGFRAGFEDMARSDLSLEAVRAFFAGHDLQILPEELDLILFEMGGSTAVFGWE